MAKAHFILFGGALLLLVGCARDWGAASGTATLDGKRMEKGMVTFHAVAGGADAYAQIQSDGSFYAMTGTDKGLKIGDYVVTVVNQTTPAASGEFAKLLSPEKYASPATSDLKVTIKPGTNVVELVLKN